MNLHWFSEEFRSCYRFDFIVFRLNDFIRFTHLLIKFLSDRWISDWLNGEWNRNKIQRNRGSSSLCATWSCCKRISVCSNFCLNLVNSVFCWSTRFWRWWYFWSNSVRFCFKSSINWLNEHERIERRSSFHDYFCRWFSTLNRSSSLSDSFAAWRKKKISQVRLWVKEVIDRTISRFCAWNVEFCVCRSNSSTRSRDSFKRPWITSSSPCFRSSSLLVCPNFAVKSVFSATKTPMVCTWIWNNDEWWKGTRSSFWVSFYL